MKIDVFHDTVCPWCRIGKKHMELALAQYDGEVEIRYHTFFLNNNIPPEGADFHTYMMAKGRGMVTDIEQFFDAPREMGRRVDLTFNFEAITKAPNTTDSHRLIAMTPADRKVAMIDALYEAYFENGQDIGNRDVLVSVAESVGLDGADVRGRLATDEAHQQVIGEAMQGQQLGVTGVPMFVFNNTLAFSGAQPPEAFLQMMQQAEDLAL
ncbi:MAG: DsbA family oxidoreductase [Chloroflexota bacterium]